MTTALEWQRIDWDQWQLLWNGKESTGISDSYSGMAKNRLGSVTTTLEWQRIDWDQWQLLWNGKESTGISDKCPGTAKKLQNEYKDPAPEIYKRTLWGFGAVVKIIWSAFYQLFILILWRLRFSLRSFWRLVFCDVTPYRLVNGYQCIGLHDPEDEGTMICRNVSSLLSMDNA